MSLLGLIIMIDQFFKKMSNYHFLFIVLFQGLEIWAFFKTKEFFSTNPLKLIN